MVFRFSRAVGWIAAAFLFLVVSARSSSATTRAEATLIAAATNFADAAGELERNFEARTPHRLTITFGSTGKLYAQIRAGAPFDAFLSADQERPRKLEAAGAAVSGSRFTYAVGQLMLWTPDDGLRARNLMTALQAPQVRALAIANPDLAPYGAAAAQVLRRVKLWQQLRPKIVMGENIGQAFALVATGNASIGFVARSQLLSAQGKALKGRSWPVPADLHDPIRQDSVLLKRGADNAAAKSFLAYLRSADARAILERFGYKTSID